MQWEAQKEKKKEKNDKNDFEKAKSLAHPNKEISKFALKVRFNLKEGVEVEDFQKNN